MISDNRIRFLVAGPCYVPVGSLCKIMPRQPVRKLPILVRVFAVTPNQANESFCTVLEGILAKSFSRIIRWKQRTIRRPVAYRDHCSPQKDIDRELYFHSHPLLSQPRNGQSCYKHKIRETVQRTNGSPDFVNPMIPV
jgi:hypothetical protein